MPEKHSWPVTGGRAVWFTERLWQLAQDLPVHQVAIREITEFEQVCWFDATSLPTCRAVAEHAQRIQNADLTFPIILAADGHLMDGGHRLAKAWLAGLTHVEAVRFPIDPDPDFIEPANASDSPHPVAEVHGDVQRSRC
jgi:hypothetical protein